MVFCFRLRACRQRMESDALMKVRIHLLTSLQRPDRHTGRFCRWDRPDTEILRTSHFLPLPEIRISSRQRNWLEKDTLPDKTVKRWHRGWMTITSAMICCMKNVYSSFARHLPGVLSKRMRTTTVLCRKTATGCRIMPCLWRLRTAKVARAIWNGKSRFAAEKPLRWYHTRTNLSMM